MVGGEYNPNQSRFLADNVRHLMTGVGAYYYIVWGVWLRHCLNYRQDEYELLWPHWWSMPVVIKQRENGSKRKAL